MKKNQLINLCMPVLQELRRLQMSQSSELPDNLGDELFQSLLKFEHHCLENQIPSHHISEAKYALAALLDEGVMRSHWSGKSTWMDQSLQLRLFGEHLAGVNFFEKLARIRQSGELNIAVLELFFICLQLGFQGKYAMTQEEELKALQVDIKHQIDLYEGGFDSSLCLISENKSNSLSDPKKKIPEWTWAGVFVATLMLLYSGYGLRLRALHQHHQVLVEQAISQISVY